MSALGLTVAVHSYVICNDALIYYSRVSMEQVAAGSNIVSQYLQGML